MLVQHYYQLVISLSVKQNLWESKHTNNETKSTMDFYIQHSYIRLIMIIAMFAINIFL